MSIWVVPYVLFVFVLLIVIYITVQVTYDQLHLQNEAFTNPSSATKCILFSSDKVEPPWIARTAWMDKCKTQDADKLVGGVEALVNLASVKSWEQIPNANLQRIFVPIGTTDTLRVEFTKDLFDVYPKHVFVKEGHKITLISADTKVKKTYTASTKIDSSDTLTFKNGTIEVKEIVPDTEDVSSELRDFVLKGKLKSKMNSNFCVTAKKNSTDVITSECTPDYREQEWKRDEEGRIVSAANNTCLHVRDDNTIIQDTCDRVPRQVWRKDTAHRLLANNSTSMCLQPNGESVVEGANLVMKDCKKEIIQHWLM